jgi:hypothetical protein
LHRRRLNAPRITFHRLGRILFYCLLLLLQTQKINMMMTMASKEHFISAKKDEM